MPDPRNQAFHFEVTDVENMPAPFPAPGAHVEVETTRSGTASIHIQYEDRPITLTGDFDRQRQTIVGNYDTYGSFRMRLETKGTPRPDVPSSPVRVRCEVAPRERGNEPGCWIAEEDPTCCVHDDAGTPR